MPHIANENPATDSRFALERQNMVAEIRAIIEAGNMMSESRPPPWTAKCHLLSLDGTAGETQSSVIAEFHKRGVLLPLSVT